MCINANQFRKNLTNSQQGTTPDKGSAFGGMFRRIAIAARPDVSGTAIQPPITGGTRSTFNPLGY